MSCESCRPKKTASRLHSQSNSVRQLWRAACNRSNRQHDRRLRPCFNFPSRRSHMSISAIPSNLLNFATQALTGSSSSQQTQAQQTQFQELTQALQSGSTPAGQLTNAGVLQTPQTQTQSSIQSTLANELKTLGADLQAGNLSGAQQAYSALKQELDKTAHHAHHHHRISPSQDSTAAGGVASSSSSGDSSLFTPSLNLAA